MQLYVADYLGDTQHLTTEQHGAYLLLLMAMWRNEGSLQNDPTKLARIARVSARRWHIVSVDVMAFFDIEGETVTQKRLVREHQKALSISEKRSASGKRGAEAKSLKSNDLPSANAKQLLQHSQIPEPYREKKEGTNVPSKERDFDPQFEAFYAAYPRHVGKGAARRAFAGACRKTDPESLTKAARRFAGQVVGKDPKFIPHPASWLNGERWDDDLPTQPPTRDDDWSRREAEIYAGLQ